MTDCAECGHELGTGRYCTNCGHPVDGAAPSLGDEHDGSDWRTGTAERPRPRTPPAPPPAPPPAWTPPSAPRFPLFADEVDEVDGVGGVDGLDGPVGVAEPPPAHHRRAPWGRWVAAAAVLAVVVVLGVWLLGDDDGDGSAAREPGPSASATATGDPSADEPDADTPAGLTAESEVTVPATAEPNQDVNGKPVDYEAANMLDGVPETCWRMPGDGSGEEIVITLPAKTRLRSVGLINGYAKQMEGRDWYHGNRRIAKVEWEFDDGTKHAQVLEDTTAVQSIDVDTTTTTITLRLVDVSKPGKGKSGRDFTAISDLLFVAR
ncbi:NADase-type glycan-binding domain-containing protein [Nocardioides sp. URHA0020]|uniref:NADase-type glycan-binding domain-containing protein n=1 Tax=Nocardioides sp. URHA0020 TaxID=1380392 RepID=UPI0004917648|nr:zinc ribbon domain-containing protein [Nocardioides sp. URHA0020]